MQFLILKERVEPQVPDWKHKAILALTFAESSYQLAVDEHVQKKISISLSKYIRDRAEWWGRLPAEVQA
jgi:hypothetical protein